MEVVGHTPEEAKAVGAMALEQFGDSFRQLDQSGASLKLGFQQAWVEKQRDDTVEQAVKSLRNRVDKWGVSEAEIKRLRGGWFERHPDPAAGVQGPERAKKLPVAPPSSS